MVKPMIAGGGGGGGGSKAGTTYVQADSTCFRDLVQRLTGASAPVKSPPPKPTQKLHERRKYNKPKIEIDIQFQQPKMPTSPLMLCAGSQSAGLSPWSYPVSPCNMMMLSPSPSSFRAGPTSMPVLARNSNKRASPSTLEELLNPEEEEKAIKEKRFYLHPSPRSKPRLAEEPKAELLTLFPPRET